MVPRKRLLPLLVLALLCLTSHQHKAAFDEEGLYEEVTDQENNKPHHPIDEEMRQNDQFNLEIPQGQAEFISPNKPISYYVEKYSYEMVWGVVFVVALFVFFRGKEVNEGLAQAWKKACLEVISKNFAHFGLDKETSTALEQVSYYEYLFYATGRVNTLYAMFKIELKRRHCLFTTCCFEILWPSKDLVTVEIPVNVPDYTLSDGTVTNNIPLDLIICRKRDMKNLFSTYTYMKNFVSPIQPKSFKTEITSSNSLIVLGESEEAVNFMIDSNIGQILSEIGEEHVQEIHITDQKIFNSTPLMMRAQLVVNPGKPKESAKILSMVLQMVDRSVNLRLSAQARQKADKNRKAVEKVRQQEDKEKKEEEALKKKREEDLKYNEMIKGLSPEEQRKMEEKKHKKDLKKNQAKMQKFVKM